MSRSKKIFAAFAIVFLLFLVYVVYDISSRTTFPGSKNKNPDHASPAPDVISDDSLKTDSLP